MKIDLGLEKTESPQENLAEVDDFAALVNSMNDTIASFHIGIKFLSDRIATVERHVAYLLTQDPTVGATIREHSAKMDASNEPKA
jgi:hypothetical protein